MKFQLKKALAIGRSRIRVVSSTFQPYATNSTLETSSKLSFLEGTLEEKNPHYTWGPALRLLRFFTQLPFAFQNIYAD